ncbi:hypothetical protein TKK_0014534 [Trichogramma kaykai]
MVLSVSTNKRIRIEWLLADYNIDLRIADPHDTCSSLTGDVCRLLADVIFNNNKELENNNFNTLSDDIYLDDQDVSEGSGRGGGEVRDDLEASGSGLGPDDEDGDERGNY